MQLFCQIITYNKKNPGEHYILQGQTIRFEIGGRCYMLFLQIHVATICNFLYDLFNLFINIINLEIIIIYNTIFNCPKQIYVMHCLIKESVSLITFFYSNSKSRLSNILSFYCIMPSCILCSYSFLLLFF